MKLLRVLLEHEHPTQKRFYFFHVFFFRLPLEPSSQRFITHFEIGEPFEKEGMEFAVIKIKGQSFMLHQIRKMIGMAISVVRGQCPMETIGKFCIVMDDGKKNI